MNTHNVFAALIRLYLTALLLVLSIYIHQPLWIINAQSVLTGSQLIPYDNQNPLSLLQEEIKLNIRTITDESEITFTFIAPNNQKVNLTIDGELHEDITSPYTIKDLSIGIHKLTFAYINAKNIPRELTINLVVVPKKPIITSKKNLFIKPEPIKVTGRAFPNSYVMVIVNSDQIMFIPTTPDGTWEFIPNYTKLGTYNMLFFSYKNGLISKNAASLKIEYRLRPHATTELTTTRSTNSHSSLLGLNRLSSKVTALKSLLKDKYNQLFNLIFHNPHGIWAGISILSALGISLILILAILYYIIKKRRSNIDNFTLEELLNKIPDIQDNTKEDTPNSNNETTTTSKAPKKTTKANPPSKATTQETDERSTSKKRRKSKPTTKGSKSKNIKRTSNKLGSIPPKDTVSRPAPSQSAKKQKERSNTSKQKQVTKQRQVKVKKGKRIETLL